MTDKIDFLDSETPEEEIAEDVVEETTEAVPEAEAKVEAEAPEGEGETQEAEPPAADEPPSQSIPVTALLDEREKRQEAQRKAEEAERRATETNSELAKLKREIEALRQPKEEAPDWYEDPVKAAQFQSQSIEQRIEQQRLQQSKFFAEREFGADVVTEAMGYFDKNPQLSQQFMAEPSPFHAAVEFYKRQKVVEEIGTDPEAWKAQQIEALREELTQSIAQPTKPKAPPPSMASAGSVGKDAISPGNGFDALFPD